MQANVQAGAVETPEEFIKRRDAEISTWLDRRDALNSIKPQELEARNTVAATLFPNPEKGTNRYHLNGGYSIKLVHSTTYKLGNKDKIEGEGEEARKVPIEEQVQKTLDKLFHHLTTSGKTNDEAIAFCKQLIVWKPELHENTYLALDPTNNVDAVTKGIIDEILTTKPATPQMEFEIPKEKR